MGLISNGSTVFDNGSMGSGFGGSLVFLSKQTASASSTISFTSGIDSTYKEYVIYFNNMHPSNDLVDFRVNFRDGGASFDATKTTTAFGAMHLEDGSSANLSYSTAYDLAQSTSPQFLSPEVGNDNDQSVSGYLHLFNPSSTTFVKHFLAKSSVNQGENRMYNYYIAGYCNTTNVIDGVQFTMESGNIDAGDICLYGIA